MKSVSTAAIREAILPPCIASSLDRLFGGDHCNLRGGYGSIKQNSRAAAAAHQECPARRLEKGGHPASGWEVRNGTSMDSRWPSQAIGECWASAGGSGFLDRDISRTRTNGR